MAALDAVVLLARKVAARIGAARAADDDRGCSSAWMSICSRVRPGKFRRQHEVVGGFVEVDRRRPAGSVGADKMPDLFVQGEQIAQRIPPREGHVSIVARLAGLGHMCYDCKDIQAQHGVI